MKKIVVRKNKSQRAGMWFLLVLMICAVIAVCFLCSPLDLSFLLFLPIILPAFFMVLYYEIWQVSLISNTITIKRLFFGTKTYSYVQISDAYTAYSYTLHEHICLSFNDGKKIIFRMEDENASIARREIQSHHSIRILNW